MSNFNTEGLLKIFPPALQKSPDFWNLARVIAPELDLLFQAANNAAILPNIDTLDEATLDRLAYEFGIGWWKPDATVAQKRLAVKSAFLMQRQLGTKAAVQYAVDTFLGGGTVEEWFEYSGEPYHFRITGADLSDIMANYDAFLRVLEGVVRYSALLDPFDGVYLTDEYDQHLLYEAGSYLML